MAHVKICCFGDGGVGKTSLTIQLCSNHFVEEYDPGIEDSYRKQVEIDGAILLLEIFDTAGRDDSTAVHEYWIKESEGFAIIYSITSRSGFELVNWHADRVLRIKNSESFPITIVGNKVDLEDKREVSTQEGQDLARTFGAQFLETSAKTRLNLEELFFGLARSIRKNQVDQEEKKKAATKKKSCSML